ncbi:hypothetical protein FHS89_000242 [Rubricella aquisinus]|uniref:VCBS repeat-containing protein n=1 Tax=Rubricella aquisinus TaxID=2028108 RepID=A0A840WVH5_9RHOB|nr:hypothetical protein [Rubricella aquisinus]MBB5514244.1 hypothetical protein [Rubricella aquisinus]
MIRAALLPILMVSMACGPASLLPDGTVLPDGDLSTLDEAQRGGVFAVLGGITAPEDLRVAQCDLSFDDQPELIVFGTGPDQCDAATGDCLNWVLEATEDGWLPVMEGAGSVQIAISSSMGRPDLVTTQNDGALIVQKFDGVAWRASLEGLIYGEAEEDLAGYGTPDDFGYLSVAWGGEASDVAAYHAAKTIVDRTTLEVGLADLNEDGVAEVILRSISQAGCGRDGCDHWVYDASGPSPALLMEAQGTDMEVLATSANGYRDLGLWTRAGLMLHRFDGAAYR